MGKLFFASFVTLGLLSGFVFGVVMAVWVYAGDPNIWYALIATAIFNVIAWLIGPAISDLFNKWFYKVRFLSKEELMQLYPEVTQLIEQISSEYKFKFPKVGIIPDKNPTAFTYGSARYNSRIILTEGIFHFLNPEEARAVVAHELGHIVNRDFIVMMIASTLVQMLYEIYSNIMRSMKKSKKGKGKGPFLVIALVSYVLYIIGIYLLYYLSRTREYLADAFSAKYTDPNDLSNALIKIAYGIVTVEDDDSTKRLLQSTRHLGILDVNNAKHYGITSYISHQDPNVLAEVMVFDKVSPWAKLAELGSTHPLTGKRIDHLSDIAKTKGTPFYFDIDGAIARMGIKYSRLWGSFSLGLLMTLLPWALLAYAFFYLPMYLIPAAIAAGMLLQIPYKFPFTKTQETTVLEQMRNPYASPLRGKPVLFSGNVIGRGTPGYIFGEDMMYQDSTGLIFLNYNSALGFLGNLFFALKRLKTLINVPSQAAGWFFRGLGSTVSLRYIQTDQKKIRSHPILWLFLVPIVLIFCSYYLSNLTNENAYNMIVAVQQAVTSQGQ